MTPGAVLLTAQWPNNQWICVCNPWTAVQIGVLHHNTVVSACTLAYWLGKLVMRDKVCKDSTMQANSWSVLVFSILHFLCCMEH